MKKYTVTCQESCGKVLGTLELPDGTPLTTQDKGYLCGDCAKKLSVNVISRPKSIFSPDQMERLRAFKAKLGPKGKVGHTELDELISILFLR